MGLRTYRLKPVTTRRWVNAPGTGVPPARANSTNVARTGTKPTITRAAPPARTTIQAGDWYSTFQPVIAHGTHTAPTPAASTNHAMLSTAPTDLRTPRFSRGRQPVGPAAARLA